MKATLSGKPLLGGETIAWPLREGTKPVIQTFNMAPLDAVAVSTAKGPLALNLTPDRGNAVNVEQLWVLNVMPGESPFVSRVSVADRRWFWSYGHVLRRYNMRRNVGTKRLIANDQVPAVNPISQKIAYWKWSLDNGQPWVALSCLQDVLKAVSEPERKYVGTRFTAVIDDRIGRKLRALPLEELAIDDAGDQALQRVLSYLPEAMVYVDDNGNVNVTSRATGDEKKIIQALMPEIVGEGHTDLVENRLIRPKEIHVLFTREAEVRFNFTENALASGATVTADPVDGRVMDNVLPSQDYQLTAADGVPGEQAPIALGTWITFDEAFTYWGNLPFITTNGAARKLDHDIVQRAFVPGMDLWAALHLAGRQPDNDGQIKPWTARIAACQNHYRMSFRISPPFMDRTLSIRAYRATTADPVKATRAPALAYGDYSVLYTQQTLIKQIRQGESPDWIINKTAYPSSGNLDSTAEPSPAEVSVVDSDQGIVRVVYKPNPVFGMGETILPSQVQSESIPTADMTRRTRPISFDSMLAGGNPPRLAPSFKLAIVLTAVPAAPNTSDQLHRIVVKPDDVRDKLPDSQQAGLGAAQGPIMEIRIGADVEVARIAWNDGRAGDIERVFGLGDGPPNLDGLVINEKDPADIQNGASLDAIAKARAAQIYASLVDRFEGGMTGHMNGQVRPAGWLSEVRHEISAEGAATTVLEMPTQVPQFSLFSFLDSNSRAVIMRLVQPER